MERQGFAYRVASMTALMAVASIGSAIDLAYEVHSPPFGVGFNHDLLVEGASLVDGAGSPTAVGDFNFLFGTLSGYVEAFSDMATDITAVGSGPHDEFRIVSPTSGLFRTEGRIGPPGGLYEGIDREFTGMGHGDGAGTSIPTIWSVEILSTGEDIGTPVRVDVTAIIQGRLFANKLTHTLKDDAFASWKVYAEGLKVIEGSSVIVDGPGDIEFHDDNLFSPVTFMSAVGDTFSLEVLYDLRVNGNTPNSLSFSEVNLSEVHVGATVVPEPVSVIGLALGTGLLLKRRRKAVDSN
ncbi:MAG: PEP-CTERM sorting domain-containing protein [Fimbriimonadaceae bacterium]|nr:PEP-CTERM sorting domain-containing protein [Fimbriimonadaceae bacterium]